MTQQDPWDEEAYLAECRARRGPFWPDDHWCNTEPKPREFLIEGWLAAGSGALLAGEGGTGKSLLGQLMASCVALGLPFLGYKTRQANATYITCEDDENELHHRQRAINAALGVEMSDYQERLTLWCRKGELHNELATFDGDRRLVPSAFMEEIEETTTARCGNDDRVLILDNAAHVFAGNEIIRHDVAAFCNLLDRLAMKMNGSVVLLAHTPKSGAEYSGSTGWDAHVRQRMHLSFPEDGLDEDERVLKRSKANYARRGETVAFRWHKGAFYLPTEIPSGQFEEMRLNVQANAENAAFLNCLTIATENRRAVSHNPGVNYAPAVFAKMPEGKQFTRKAYEAAFERLLHLGLIELDQELWQGANRHRKIGIKAAEKCATPPAPTPRADPRQGVPQVIDKPSVELRASTPLYTTYNGAAPEAAAPSEDDIYFPDDEAAE